MLLWTPPSQPVNGYRIYIEPRHLTNYWYADGNSSQVTIHSLQERTEYNMSMLSLSAFFPSVLTLPVEVTIKQGGKIYPFNIVNIC